jgi:hypothetical protein
MEFNKVEEIRSLISGMITLDDCWTCQRSYEGNGACMYDQCEGYVIREGFAKNIAKQIINIL